MGLSELRRTGAPTPMGERLLAFMSANYVSNSIEFAEGVLGIPEEELRRWIFEPLSPDEIPLRPLLRCAEALGTNVEFLTGITDDPRPPYTLNYDEAVLLQAFRDADCADRDWLLRKAQAAAARANAPAHLNQPFPRLPVRRTPPGAANEA